MASLSDEFEKAESALGAAEYAHLGALEALQQAIEFRQFAMQAKLRKAAAASEAHLVAAVDRAQDVHRRFWRAEAEKMVPGLRRAIADLRRYREMMLAAGVRGADQLLIDETNADTSRFGVSAEVVVTTVPIAGPVSEVLQDLHGSWRRPGG